MRLLKNLSKNSFSNKALIQRKRVSSWF